MNTAANRSEADQARSRPIPLSRLRGPIHPLPFDLPPGLVFVNPLDENLRGIGDLLRNRSARFRRNEVVPLGLKPALHVKAK